MKDILEQLQNGASEEEIVAAFTEALNKAKAEKAKADAESDKVNRFLNLLETAKDFLKDFYPSETELVEEISSLQEDPADTLKSLEELLVQARYFNNVLRDFHDLFPYDFPEEVN